MIVLGIETSCDETAAAVRADGKTIGAAISSSVALHQQFGGIIPEIASRFHLEYMVTVAESALNQANIPPQAIDAIAVTYRPGLLGSLLVGVSFAKGLCLAFDRPLIGVNHIHAHFFSPFLEHPPQFPFIAMAISGGHTSIALINDYDQVRIIGRTRDDAAGEAFDKVAKILGLSYPGGPLIDKLAQTAPISPGNPSLFRFTCAPLSKTLDFSFSGIKTAVLYATRAIPELTPELRAEIAAAFQHSVVELITHKAIAACQAHSIRVLGVGGGVACNSALRRSLAAAAAEHGISLHLAPPSLCQDNAVMVAELGTRLLEKGYRSTLTLAAQSTYE